MKYVIGFLAGSTVTTAAVVLAGGYHAGMVILGGILSLTALLVLGKMLGIPRLVRWLTALDSANSALQSANAVKPVTVIDDREEPQKRKRSKLLQTVLRPIQQDVVSALVNLGMQMGKAERTVLECTAPGDSFDDLLKKALTSIPRKTA